MRFVFGPWWFVAAVTAAQVAHDAYQENENRKLIENINSSPSTPVQSAREIESQRNLRLAQENQQLLVQQRYNLQQYYNKKALFDAKEMRKDNHKGFFRSIIHWIDQH